MEWRRVYLEALSSVAEKLKRFDWINTEVVTQSDKNRFKTNQRFSGAEVLKVIAWRIVKAEWNILNV